MDGVSFGYSTTEQEYDDIFGVDPPRYLVAVQDGRFVGTAGEYRFEMTVPGGRQLSVPGVTWVSVLPTHRRRGVLRAMMQQLLAGYHAHGYPAAVLTASEGGIYRRFGFGPSTQSVKIAIDRDQVRPLQPVDTSQVRYLSAAEARAPIMDLHRRWRLQTPGALNRTDSWWDHLFNDREWHRNGMSEKFYLVHPDGYLAYRAAEVWTDGLPASRCSVVDYRPVTPTAHAALWQVLLGMDLFGSIESWELPLDDPLPFLLDDPRQVRIVASKDGMWLRPVELLALLAARTLSGRRRGGAGGGRRTGPAVRRPVRCRVPCRPTGRPTAGSTGPPSARSIWAATGRARCIGPACSSWTIRCCSAGWTWPSPPSGRPATAPRSEQRQTARVCRTGPARPR